MNTRFDKKALLLLIAILRSCMFLRKEELNFSQKAFFTGVIAGREDVSIDEVVSLFRIEAATIDEMRTFFGNEFVREEDVANFFTGASHMKSAISDVHQICPVGGKKEAEYLLFHMLLPIVVTEVTKVDDGEGVVVSGFYENGETAIEFRNIRVSFTLPPSFEPGQSILIHYGCAVGVVLSLEMLKSILGEQAKIVELMEACQRVGVIDCGKTQELFLRMHG